MKIVVFDIETDGFGSSLIYCLSYAYLKDGEWITGTITDYQKMGEFLKRFDYYVCHNLIRFDLPALEKHTNVTIPYQKCIDTLALSWWLFPSRLKHGLDSWGETVGVQKPVIESWEGLPLEEYINRCEEDVEINRRAFLVMNKKLKQLYGKDTKKIREVIEYASFKMWTIHLAEKSPLTLDIQKVDKILNRMELLLSEKRERLIAVMPKVAVKKITKKPVKMFKKDESLSAMGVKWQNLLIDRGLPLDREEPVEYIGSWKEPNPNSPSQKKDWLLSLGWRPLTFKYVKDGKEKRAIPQLRKGKELCPSVLLLIEKQEEVRELEGYSVLMSRTGMLKGFLRDSEGGKIAASASGFTNCVTADTIITTNRGAIPIVEVNKLDQVLTHNGVWREVTDCINNGVKQVYEIETSKGKKLRCTSEHRLYIGKGTWKKAKDISVGDIVVGYGEKEFWREVGRGSAISSWGRFMGERGNISKYSKRQGKSSRNFSSFITKSGAKVDRLRARLVMEKFSKGTGHVLHKDGKSSNDNLQNLYYGTDQDNHNDTKKHGTLVKAHRDRINSKLTPEKVKSIRERLSNGELGKDLAKEFGVTSSMISGVKNGTRWSDEVITTNTYRESFETEVITTIELGDFEPTFDISVEGDHSYVANGLVTHNTMRLKHKTLVNLPGVLDEKDSNYNGSSDGKWIRGCLITTEGREICGSDISSLEDSTKQHYMFKYDPKFVAEMQAKGFDPHLDIAKFAGMLTMEQIDDHLLHKKTKGKQGTDYGSIRKGAKVVNFSSVYGIGAKALSLATGMPIRQCEKLLEAYWKRNWAVLEVAKEQYVKTLPDGEMWLLNPVSGFYYSLRYDKDRFSTLNQGTGVFVFDTWLKHILRKRPQLSGQFHDEIILQILKGRRAQCSKLLQEAMDATNAELKLNVTISIDTQFGASYSEVH